MLVALGVALLAAAAALDLFVYGARPPATTPTAPLTTAPLTTAPIPPPFAIASLEAPAPGPYSARVVWTTTAPSRGQLQWGPAGMRHVLWSSEPAPSAEHTVTLDGLTANTTYAVEVAASSADGARAARSFEFRTAAAPTSVTASIEQATVRVNGGSFFPLIAWFQCADRWPASIAEGIDLFGGNGCTSLASLATGVAGQALAAGTSDDPPVEAPSLLGWFYPDEADARGLTGATMPATPSGLRFLTLTAHFFAGAAPLPSGRSMYPGLVSRADVVGFDLYPLQELCRRDFLAAVFDAQQALTALAPGKPTFQWIEARELKCPTVPVTPATVRAESWLALAGGAHGLGFFPQDWDPAIGAAIGGVTARIRQLEPALLEPARPLRLESSSPDVRASERRWHDARYVVAVNAGTTAASIRVPGPRPPIALAGSATRLPPLGVGIYVFPPDPYQVRGRPR